jgi:hypothetical protein
MIETRADAAVSLMPIADTVVKTLPNYRDLLEVCQTWRSSTRAALLANADGIGDLAGLATAAYQLIADFVKELDPDTPLTPAQAKRAHDLMDPIAAALAERRTVMSSVDDALTRFSNVNQVTDSYLEKIQGGLGPEWTALNSQTSAIDAAIGKMRGEWGAVVDDFTALADGGLKLTTGFLLSLRLEAAIIGWTNLREEILEFAGAAPRSELLRLAGAARRRRLSASHRSA